jgi:hypothetical protein
VFGDTVDKFKICSKRPFDFTLFEKERITEITLRYPDLNHKWKTKTHMPSRNPSSDDVFLKCYVINVHQHACKITSATCTMD